MTDDAKLIFTVIGFFVGIAGLVPYILDILRRKTKPHSFSWLIWMLLTAIGFTGQIAGHGGSGSWITGLNSTGCFLIFLLSLKYGEKIITKSDWISFAGALLAIPLWLVTHTPLFSMILITLIDALGFYPTFRKSWHKPHEETIFAFFLSTMMYGCGLLGLEKYTIVTTLYPASITISNVGFCFYSLWRRKVLAREIQ
jgi:hypothetical protein